MNEQQKRNAKIAKRVIRAILSVISAIAIMWFGMILVLVTAISGKGFYTYLCFFAIPLVLFAFLTIIWSWFKRRIRWFIAIASVLMLILSAGVYEVVQLYDKNIPIVSEQSLDLSKYEPFADGTLAASLDEPPSYNVGDKLLRLDGATALYPLYSAFVRATYPSGNYTLNENNTVECSGTIGAYDRLIAGYTDIIIVAGPSAEQLSWAESRGIELVLTPIGKEAFVFFANKKNKVNNLTADQIKGIYSGEITNWNTVGGSSAKITAYQRPANSGSQTMLEKVMADTSIMTPPEDTIVGGMEGIIRKVSEYKNIKGAIGYSFRFFSTEMVKDNKIKLLSINEVAPTRENIANSTYPFASEFYAVTAGPPDEEEQKFIDWMLSSQGQELVEKTGYNPIS